MSQEPAASISVFFKPGWIHRVGMTPGKGGRWVRSDHLITERDSEFARADTLSALSATRFKTPTEGNRSSRRMRGQVFISIGLMSLQLLSTFRDKMVPFCRVTVAPQLRAGDVARSGFETARETD